MDSSLCTAAENEKVANSATGYLFIKLVCALSRYFYTRPESDMTFAYIGHIAIEFCTAIISSYIEHYNSLVIRASDEPCAGIMP